MVSIQQCLNNMIAPGNDLYRISIHIIITGFSGGIYCPRASPVDFPCP